MSHPTHSPEYTYGWDSLAFAQDTHVIISLYLVLLCSLMILSLLIQHYWGKVWKFHFIPEAGVVILLGTLLVYITNGNID